MGVSVGVPLPVPLPVPVTVGELLGVPLFDGVPLSVPVGAGVVEGLAPLEREAVGVALVLEDRDGVGLRVVEGVSVPVPVPVPAAATQGEAGPLESSLDEDANALASIDPLLEKISRNGLGSLTSEERAQLELAREALLKKESGRP